jgi:hypothetical protein
MPAALRVLVLVAAHPKLRSFVRLCAWSILSLRPKLPIAHYPVFIVCLVTTLFKKKFHKWKNSVSLLKLLRTCTCPGFFLEKNSPIVIPQVAHQALGMCYHVGFLRFTPPLCDYSRSPSTWDLQFSSASQLGASTRKWGSWFRLGEVEPSFKEFLAPPAHTRFQVLRSFLLLPQWYVWGWCQLSQTWVVRNRSQLAIF